MLLNVPPFLMMGPLTNRYICHLTCLLGRMDSCCSPALSYSTMEFTLEAQFPSSKTLCISGYHHCATEQLHKIVVWVSVHTSGIYTAVRFLLASCPTLRPFYNLHGMTPHISSTFQGSSTRSRHSQTHKPGPFSCCLSLLLLIIRYQKKFVLVYHCLVLAPNSIPDISLVCTYRFLTHLNMPFLL